MTRTDLCFKIAATLSGVASGQFAMDLADDVLDTIEQSGLRVVPVEATEEMRRAGDEWTSCVGPCLQRTGRQCWATMLAASPFAPGDGK